MGELRSIRSTPLVHLCTYADKSVSEGVTVMTSPSLESVRSRDASSITDRHRGVPSTSARYIHCLLRHVAVQRLYLIREFKLAQIRDAGFTDMRYMWRFKTDLTKSIPASASRHDIQPPPFLARRRQAPVPVHLRARSLQGVDTVWCGMASVNPEMGAEP
ncbi:hypothetical protein C8Q74DRAFT_198386 [Fomes fomentarius]|nr:hypothetical protein C8Q74DRAFT_198386 [Fomes fomentarius]